MASQRKMKNATGEDKPRNTPMGIAECLAGLRDEPRIQNFTILDNYYW